MTCKLHAAVVNNGWNKLHTDHSWHVTAVDSREDVQAMYILSDKEQPGIIILQTGNIALLLKGSETWTNLSG